MARHEAKNFSEEVLGGVRADPGAVHGRCSRSSCRSFVAAISGYHGDKLALATFLTRITFPYLILISLVSLFSGILNAAALYRGGVRARRCSISRC